MLSRKVRSAAPRRVEVGCQQQPVRKFRWRRRLGGQRQRRDRKVSRIRPCLPIAMVFVVLGLFIGAAFYRGSHRVDKNLYRELGKKAKGIKYDGDDMQ